MGKTRQDSTSLASFPERARVSQGSPEKRPVRPSRTRRVLRTESRDQPVVSPVNPGHGPGPLCFCRGVGSLVTGDAVWHTRLWTRPSVSPQGGALTKALCAQKAAPSLMDEVQCHPSTRIHSAGGWLVSPGTGCCSGDTALAVPRAPWALSGGTRSALGSAVQVAEPMSDCHPHLRGHLLTSLLGNGSGKGLSTVSGASCPLDY